MAGSPAPSEPVISMATSWLSRYVVSVGLVQVCFITLVWTIPPPPTPNPNLLADK